MNSAGVFHKATGYWTSVVSPGLLRETANAVVALYLERYAGGLREVGTGRGPVDFHFSNGLARRALIEAKLANNGEFWNNLVNQLPEYMLALEITRGSYHRRALILGRAPREAGQGRREASVLVH